MTDLNSYEIWLRPSFVAMVDPALCHHHRQGYQASLIPMRPFRQCLDLAKTDKDSEHVWLLSVEMMVEPMTWSLPQARPTGIGDFLE